MRASINGEERDLPVGLTLSDLLKQMGAPERGIAIAKNERVVPRSAFADEQIGEGDRIEIIQAVAGG